MKSQAYFLLKDYCQKGYLFHGSPLPDIKILGPRKATDVDNRPFNVDTAVFAADNPASAIIFAVIPPPKTKGITSGTWSVNFGKGKGPPIAKIPYLWKKILKSRKGYVYVLPKRTFVGKGGQYKSSISVAPVAKIEVKFKDFEKMGGIVKWKKQQLGSP